jgi:hypothetical protein
MMQHRPSPFLFSLIIALLMPYSAPADDGAKPAKEEPPKAARKEITPKEIVFKGALTALEQEVAHELALKGKQSYSLTTDSPGFFTDVRVEDGQGKTIALSTGKILKCPDDGVYRLLVFSPGGSSGEYVLSVRPFTFKEVKAGDVLAVGPEGLTVEAILTKDDPLDKARQKHCRAYDVEMNGDKTYVIDLMSKQFDAFLRLEDAGGKQLAQDDDSGGGTNARIRFKAPGAGVYRVIVTSFGPETGLFQLKIREQ